MSRKNRTQPTQDKKTSEKIVLYVAIIGLFGTLVTALFGYLNTRTQIELPIQITQTAQAITSSSSAPSLGNENHKSTVEISSAFDTVYGAWAHNAETNGEKASIGVCRTLIRVTNTGESNATLTSVESLVSWDSQSSKLTYFDNSLRERATINEMTFGSYLWDSQNAQPTIKIVDRSIMEGQSLNLQLDLPMIIPSRTTIEIFVDVEANLISDKYALDGMSYKDHPTTPILSEDMGNVPHVAVEHILNFADAQSVNTQTLFCLFVVDK